MSEAARPDTAGPYRVTGPDEELVRAAVSGDRAALADLCEQLRPIVLGYCVRRLGSQDSGAGGAEDCTQEVMSAVLTVLPRYRYRADRFLAWVFGIAAHKIADLHRFRHRRGEKLEPLPDHDAAGGLWTVPGPDELDRLDQRLQAGRLMRRLSDTQRQRPGAADRVRVLRPGVRRDARAAQRGRGPGDAAACAGPAPADSSGRAVTAPFPPDGGSPGPHILLHGNTLSPMHD